MNAMQRNKRGRQSHTELNQMGKSTPQNVPVSFLQYLFNTFAQKTKFNKTN